MTADHGTRARYCRGCRCGECRAANSAYDRELRARAGLPEHGTRIAYKGGCRCDACREAQTDYCRQWRRGRGVTARITDEEVRYRLGELEHLLAGGVWAPSACERVGWTVPAAQQFAASRGHARVMSMLQGVPS
ncbi:hypothetical protein NLU66_16670 [Brachybacterium sp. NBEC-018]|uniref:hypothetical protein n=1 Tax=Brachybacterium sp. NBEC-018 TaxID=2996004 RepID=UPI0021750890|nr:hypothetical protein [Brachybacterium sp. NBEC-018]UVY83822.1 hypothetical protein NLU66_16670 [Brachybacterium sp. NBEC-018]